MTARGLRVDERLSWARRVGDDVRVQLRLPAAALEQGAAHVRLVNGRRQLRLPADVTAAEGASVVSFSVPQAELGRAAWHIAVQPPTSGQFVRAQARLLAPPTSPVALLPGPAPDTRMPPPAPRARTRRSPANRVARHLPGPVRSVLLRARSARRVGAARLES